MDSRNFHPRTLRRRARVIGFAVLLAAVGHVTSSGPAAAQPEDPAPPKHLPQTYALLIGCSEYPAFKHHADYGRKIRLLGCLNDVRLMRTTLIKRLGVPASHIVSLTSAPTNKQPTTTHVRAALDALAKRTYQPGDRVIVHFSGHGVQQTDDNRDELDGLDEAWLLSDGRPDPKGGFAGILRDDEIGRRLRALANRGALVWCNMDCCHSATGMRGIPASGVRTRVLKPSTVGIRVVPAKAHGTAGGYKGAPMGEHGEGANQVVVFYAAQSHQEVPEVQLPPGGADPQSYGLLTSVLERALRRSGERLTFSELYEQVVSGYRDLGQHHIVQPLAEGDLTQSVFGGPLQPASHTVRRVGRRELELSAGLLHGVAEGTELAVFLSGSAGEPDKQVGRVIVHAVRAEIAKVHPAKDESDAWAREGRGPWSAKVTRFAVGNSTLPLALVDADDRPVALASLDKTARAALDFDAIQSRFPLVRDPAAAAWLLVVRPDGQPAVLRPRVRGGGAGVRFVVTAETLKVQLLKIYRGENVLRLTARAPGAGHLPGNLRLEVRKYNHSSAPVPLPTGQRLAPASRLDLGLHKTRASGSGDVGAMDVYVFWVGPHYGIWMLYPTTVSGPRLSIDDVTRPGKPIRVGRKTGETTSDTSPGVERFIVFAQSKRVGAPGLTLDFLKQSPLQVARTRGQKANTVAALLRELATDVRGTRGNSAPTGVGANPLYMKVFEFETRWGSIRAPGATAAYPAQQISAPPPTRKPGAPPSAWDLGTSAHVAQAGPENTWCLLIGKDEGATQILVDIDGEIGTAERGGQGLRDLAQNHALDAEIAIRLEHDSRRVTAWYDIDNDGDFDHVLIDADGDQRAEERYRQTDQGWAHDTKVNLALLSTGHLLFLERTKGRGKALRRLRALAGK